MTQIGNPQTAPIKVGSRIVDEHGVTRYTETREPITGYGVNWEAAGRLFETRDEAVAFCDRNDFDPDLCIVAVPVALSENGWRRMDTADLYTF